MQKSKNLGKRGFSILLALALTATLLVSASATAGTVTTGLTDGGYITDETTETPSTGDAVVQLTLAGDLSTFNPIDYALAVDEDDDVKITFPIVPGSYLTAVSADWEDAAALGTPITLPVAADYTTNSADATVPTSGETLIVTATYTALPAIPAATEADVVVTFKDATDSDIGTPVTGYAFDAVTAPTVTGKIFKGWAYASGATTADLVEASSALDLTNVTEAAYIQANAVDQSKTNATITLYAVYEDDAAPTTPTTPTTPSTPSTPSTGSSLPSWLLPVGAGLGGAALAGLAGWWIGGWHNVLAAGAGLGVGGLIIWLLMKYVF